MWTKASALTPRVPQGDPTLNIRKKNISSEHPWLGHKERDEKRPVILSDSEEPIRVQFSACIIDASFLSMTTGK